VNRRAQKRRFTGASNPNVRLITFLLEWRSRPDAFIRSAYYFDQSRLLRVRMKRLNGPSPELLKAIKDACNELLKRWDNFSGNFPCGRISNRFWYQPPNMNANEVIATLGQRLFMARQ